MNITSENLIKEGFKKFNSEFESRKSRDYICSYQKTVIDDIGTKLFLTLHEFDEPFGYNNGNSIFISDVQLKRLTTLGKEELFNVYYFINSETNIEEFESLYLDVWTNLKCEYYKRWN